MYKIIENLEHEHSTILEFIKGFEKTLLALMEDNYFEANQYIEAIKFIREYADKQHHQREEQILFRYLVEQGGNAAKKLVQSGMLVEHDQARFFVRELEAAMLRYEQQPSSEDKLNILTYGKSYCDLLVRHIDKENNVVYPFAKRILSEQAFASIALEDEQFSLTLKR